MFLVMSESSRAAVACEPRRRPSIANSQTEASGNITCRGRAIFCRRSATRSIASTPLSTAPTLRARGRIERRGPAP